MIRKKYKNELFLLINQSGLDLNSFEIESDIKDIGDTLSTTVVKYLDSPFQFKIRTSDQSFDEFDFDFVTYSPGFSWSGIYPATNFTTFDTVSEAFENWLENQIKEYLQEFDEPDLWEEFRKSNKSLNFDTIDFNDKSSFSIEERKQINMSINELKLLINKKFQTNEAEQNIVDERLDYIIEAVNRLNKFDWKSLAISTLIGIVVALSLDTTQGHILFQLFKKVFSSIPVLH